MGDWDEHQKQFINKLDNTEKLFNEIFEKDADGLIINGETRNALLELSRRNSAILKKLKSKEFTVAVVGLEKAGKSTLGNALIKSLVLPEYRERCTYTTTEIRAGKVDEAVVSFYTRAEFNERLKMMFDEIEYGGAVDINTMRLDTFKKYWAAVGADPNKRDLFVRHDGKTTEDIKAILEGKNELMALLDQSDKKFGPEEWTSFDFKIYITGIEKEVTDDEGNVVSVVRKPHPYAVKNVTIRSTQLGDMKNIVLYDVPGFDSPTDLHKKQTLAMLIEADAIILVVNAGTNPNLTSTQLDMLQNAYDKFGVKLSDKAFVFGNRLDSAASLQDAQSNLNTLRQDAVDKFHIASDKHVLGGSARAYLEALGLIRETVAKPKIDAWHLSDGVDELHHQMQFYYDHDRYAVLKRKAEGTLKDAEKFLNELLEQYSPEILARLDDGGQYMLQAKNKLRSFIEQSNELIKDRLQKIHDDKPFSVALTDNIDKIYPLIEDAYEPLVKSIENSLVIDPDNVYPTTMVNAKVRQDLQVEFIKNIVTEVARLTEGRQAEIRAELVENFLENMEMPPASRFRAELEQSVNKMFDELLIDGGAQCYFNPLVERFTTTLIEALILSPFAEEERFKKIKINLAEFISLSVYYSANDSDQNKIDASNNLDDRLNFFSKLLTHEGIKVSAQPSKVETHVDDNAQLMRKFFADNMENLFRGINIQIDDFPIDNWKKMLNVSHIAFDGDFQDKLFQKLGMKAQNFDWGRATKAQRIQVLQDVIAEICRANRNTQGSSVHETPPRQTAKTNAQSSGTQLEDLHERGKELKTMRSKEDMIATLDADIMILRDITVKAVIKAIGLERAFISVISKNANLIRTSLEKNPYGYEKFDKWILNNIHKLKEFEFEEIDRLKQNSETRRQIVNSIQKTLEKM